MLTVDKREGDDERRTFRHEHRRASTRLPIRQRSCPFPRHHDRYRRLRHEQVQRPRTTTAQLQRPSARQLSSPRQHSHYAEVNRRTGWSSTPLEASTSAVDERIDDTADNTTDHPENLGAHHHRGRRQHPNGEQALVFAAAAPMLTATTRTANQRASSSSALRRVLALPVTELPGVIQAGYEVRQTTDMKVNDIISLCSSSKTTAIWSCIPPCCPVTG